jgi:pSer/pThr/pTyr-binding forkhead associated (FHA) protein
LHAIVHVDAFEKVYLEDKGSRNGTFLHGNQLNPNQLYPLQVGDLFRLNLNVLELIMEQTSAAQTRNLSVDSGSPVGTELLLSTLVGTTSRLQDPLAKPYERLMLLIASQKWDEAHYQVQAMLAYDASYRDIQLLSQRIAQRRILKRQQ